MSDPLRVLEWDSAFFGVRVASLAPGLDARAFAAAIERCRAERIECVHLLSDADDLATLRLAEQHGFRLTDVRLTYATKLAPRVPAPAAGRAIRPARPDDVPRLRAIAAESHRVSRFYADGGFDRARCDEMYATWIEKSCGGWADLVLVAEHGGVAAGYVTGHLRDGRGEIGLLGLAPPARGRGLARELVARALDWFSEGDVGEVTVVTQGRSLDAQRLYQAAGFRSSKVELWHHLRLGPGGA